MFLNRIPPVQQLQLYLINNKEFSANKLSKQKLNFSYSFTIKYRVLVKNKKVVFYFVTVFFPGFRYIFKVWLLLLN